MSYVIHSRGWVSQSGRSNFPRTCSTTSTAASEVRFTKKWRDSGGYRACQGLKRTRSRDLCSGASSSAVCARQSILGSIPAMLAELWRPLEQIKQNDHGTSARACQRIESSLMINGAVRQFMLPDANMPILTIHDSVLVTPEAVQVATAAIQGEFARIGLTPCIKRKLRTGKVQPKQQDEQEQARTGTLRKSGSGR